LAGRTAEAQTVMLPTFRTFSYSGAVMVPDGGGIVVGGVKRSAEGQNSAGVPGLGNIPGVGRGFGNRAIGRETGNSALSIHPQVLIMSELEEDHLAAGGYTPDGQRIGGQADAAIFELARFLTEHMGRNDSSGSLPERPR
jgi:type II secretory pathway component GspD/PulD (secretin)